MVKNFLLGLAVVALATANAATTYKVTFFQPVVVNGTQLKPGDYKVEVQDNKVLIKQGKVMAEAPVKIMSNEEKYSRDVVRMNGTDIEEIRIGGTHTRLVFDKAGVSTN